MSTYSVLDANTEAHWREALKGNSSPDGRICQLSMLTDAERHQLLVEWNDTAVDFPRDCCMHELFEEQAARTPDAVAVTFEADFLTYGQLNARANKLAHYLIQFGVGPEVLVGLCLERSLEMVIGLLGVLKAGAAYVPLDPTYPLDRLAFMLEDSQASILLSQAACLDSLPSSSIHVVCLDMDWWQVEGESESNPKSDAMADSLAYVIYTSGSTGAPKGVLLSHRGMNNVSSAQAGLLGITAGNRILQFASFSFDASVFEIIMALTSGATLCLGRPEALMPGPDLAHFLDESAISVATLPPTALQTLPFRTYPALRTLLVAGEACSGALAARWSTGRRFFNLYGPTEATIWSSYAECFADTGNAPIGRPIWNTRLYVLDHNRCLSPIGVAGELYIGGDGLARGYLGRPELTAERFVPDPFSSDVGARLYRTGDLVRYRSDGNLEFLGRLDHQVKIRGFRIELGEIESALVGHASVREAVVLAREDVPGEMRLVAYIAGNASPEIEPRALQDYLRPILPVYMIPYAFVILDSLPLTPNGKVDRKALPAPGAASLQENTYVAPRSPIEAALVEIWGTLLGVERLGVFDNFFELGGHSLLATQVMSRISSTFQIDLPMRALFDAPTVAGLAELMSQARGNPSDDSPPLVRMTHDGTRPLSFSQQRLWLAHRMDPGNPAYNTPCILRISGALSKAALQYAADMLVTRHEILRTTYKEVDGLPTQVISTDANAPIRVVDLTAANGMNYEDAFRLVVEESEIPFDLCSGPVIRATLYSLSHTEHVLALITHHIVSDRWSVPLMISEIFALYDAAIENRPHSLEELPVQYADYAVWQGLRQETNSIRQQTAYWQTHLAGAPETIKLPLDRPRPRKRSLRGAELMRDLDLEVSERIRFVAREEGATIFMLLLACFNATLYSLYKEEDIVVGTDIAGRNRVELERLIGFFVNNLVLRTSLSGNPSFRELISRVRNTALEAYANQDVPLDRLVDLLRPERDPGCAPLFQVLFVMHNVPSEMATPLAISLTPVTLDTCTSKFDLALFLLERDGGLCCNWVYATDVFEAVTIRQIAERFETIAALMVSRPEMRLSELNDELLAADVARRRIQQQQRESAVSSKFQRIKPQAQFATGSPAGSSLEGDR